MHQQMRIAPQEGAARQVHDWLRQRIIRGELPPGMRLSEPEIAAATGLSRQPVREAFIRLAVSGLAEVRPKRGTYISRISKGAVLSAQFVREAVEVDLIRRVTGQRDLPARLDALIADQRAAAEAGDTPAFMALDDRFHQTIAEAAGRLPAWAVLEDLKSQMNRLRYLAMRSFDPAVLIGQHAAIVDRIRRGAPDASASAMRQHLRQILADLPGMIEERPDHFTD